MIIPQNTALSDLLIYADQHHFKKILQWYMPLISMSSKKYSARLVSYFTDKYIESCLAHYGCYTLLRYMDRNPHAENIITYYWYIMGRKIYRASDYANPCTIAASSGHLECLKWLHEYRGYSLTVLTLLIALNNGYIHIAQYLVAKRKCLLDAVHINDISNDAGINWYIMQPRH
jgi:hypothetical protein